MPFIVIIAIYDINHGELSFHNSKIIHSPNDAKSLMKHILNEIKNEIYKEYQCNNEEEKEYVDDNFQIQNEIREIN
jgi:hypothetical protein